LLRIILAAACFTLGSALLIPTSLRLWKFLASRLAQPDTLHLPEPHTNFVLFLAGREIGDATVLAMTTALGAALLLVGLSIVR
jgi:hypothetical protein